MSNDQRKGNPLSDFLRDKADVVIRDQDRPGGLTIGQVVAWRHWFAARQRLLRSSGGRPTNPAWTLKRQIPFAIKVWKDLEDRAERCSAGGTRIGPGQLAAFLVEDAVQNLDASPGTDRDDHTNEEIDVGLAEPVEDPTFGDWHMPEIFSGVAA